MLDGELQHLMVAGRERLDRQFLAGNVDALVRQQQPADVDRARHLAAVDALDRQVQEPVVEEDRIARLHRLRQFGKLHGQALRRAFDVVGGQRDLGALLQGQPAAAERPQTDLRPRQIGENGDPVASGLGGIADQPNGGSVAVEIAMREVKAADVHAGLHHRRQYVGFRRRRTDGADDLGFVYRQRHGRLPCKRWHPSGGAQTRNAPSASM